MRQLDNQTRKKKDSIYLDTSVPSAYYDFRDKSRQRATQEFWKKLQPYNVFISELVLDELSAVTDNALSRRLSNLVKDFHILSLGEFETQLGKEYVNAGAIPLGSLTDALHLAITSVNEIDIFVSWNFRHIVNIKTRRMVSEVNRLKGYKVPVIVSPLEL